MKKTQMLKAVLLGAVLFAALSGCSRETNKRPDSSSPDATRPHDGMTEEELIMAIGKPKGEISSGKRRVLIYDGVQIEIHDGIATNVPPNVHEKIRKAIARRKERESESGTKKKSKKATARPAPSSGNVTVAPKGYIMRNESGTPIDHSAYLTPGSITVVDFYAEWCGPCKSLAPELERIVREHPGVTLRKVDIGNWGSTVAKRYNVNSVPNVRVFDRNGNMVGPPTSSPGAIVTLIQRAEKQ